MNGRIIDYGVLIQKGAVLKNNMCLLSYPQINEFYGNSLITSWTDHVGINQILFCLTNF